MFWNIVKSLLLVLIIIGLPVYFFFGRGGGEPVGTEVKPKVYRELLYVPEGAPKIYRKDSGRSLDSDLPVFYSERTVVQEGGASGGGVSGSVSTGERVYGYAEPEAPHYNSALGVSWQQDKGYLATAKATKYHRQSYTDNLGVGYRAEEGYLAVVNYPVDYSEGGYIENLEVYGTTDEGYFETVDGDFVPNEGYLERFADLYPSEDGYLEAVYSSGSSAREGYLRTASRSAHVEDYLR